MSLAEESPAPGGGGPRLGYVLTSLGVLAAGAALFAGAGPFRQALTVITVVIPLAVVGALAMGPAAYEISSARYRARLVNLVLILPAAAVFLLALNAPMVDPRINWLLAAGGVALALLAGVWMPGRAALASPGALFIVLALMGAAWGWGAPILLDTRLDASPGTPFQAPVLKRGLYFGRYGNSQYYLRLGPWGPVGQPRNVVVNSSIYWAARVGASACVTLHPGALAMAWYTARTC